MAGAEPHGDQRGQIGVVQAQLVAQAGGAGRDVVTIGTDEPLGLALVDADDAERAPELAPVRQGVQDAGEVIAGAVGQVSCS